MTLTLQIDEELSFRLEESARTQGLPVAELVRFLLERALMDEEIAMTPEDVVARLRHEVTPEPLDRIAGRAEDRAVLLDTLRAEPVDPDFDLAAWNEDWALAEAEIHRVDRMNDWAEGRG